MTKILKSKQWLVPFGGLWSRAAQAIAPRVEYWSLRFVCYLMLGICIFRHNYPRQSQLSLTTPIGLGF